MSEETLPGRIKDDVQRWLMEDGWSLRVDWPPAAIWTFVAENHFGRKIVAGQRIGREDELIIEAAIDFDDITANKIAQLSEDERNNFLWDLRFELLRTDLEFSGIETPIKRVQVSERIFCDALTKDTFLQRASQVRKGILAVQWIVARKFAQQPPKTQLGFLK